MARTAAKRALLEQWRIDGVSFVFGNPGTVEQGLVDAMNDAPDLQYVLGLHENVVVGMADGYARASRRPAVAQVHAAVGLGNSIAMLYQARRSLTPLVVIAGEVGTRSQAFDGFLAGDLVDIARPVTKWAARVLHGADVLPMWRRAAKVAMTPPYGPVFLALPMDVLEQEIEPEFVPTSFVNWRSAPPVDTLRQIADSLAGASAPMLLIGDGVAASGAREEVEQLADLLGSPIFGVDFADLNCSFRHPLFQGLLGRTFGEDTRRHTSQADVVVAVGTPLFPHLFPTDQPYFGDSARLIQIDTNAWELSKNFPASLPVLADPKLTLQGVLDQLKGSWNEERQAAAAKRRDLWRESRETHKRAREREHVAAARPDRLSPAMVADVLVRCLPADAVVYDESITSTDELLHYLEPSDPSAYFLGRGGCLGVGWPGAIGAKLAQPQRPMLAVSADGSAMFAVQALWTAARYHLDIVFVVLNNHSYRILKLNMLAFWKEQGVEPRPFPFMDLDEPEIRFDMIGRGLGVPSTKVRDAAELEKAVSEAFTRGGPFLVDVEVDGDVPLPAGDGRPRYSAP